MTLKEIIDAIPIKPYHQEEAGVIYCADCLEVMKHMPDKCVDLVLTSPPYDELRDYSGKYKFDFENKAMNLKHKIKDGGIIVWVVGDSVVDGSETGSSFKQALFFKDCGLNIHDTMIYAKKGCPFPEQNRYNQKFEYMFVFSLGKPKTTNLLKQKTLYSEKEIGKQRSSTTRNKDGTMEAMKYETNKQYTTRFNIWEYAVGFQKSTKDLTAFNHPAIFPDNLAIDHIESWSNKNDIIMDCFLGSGTTVKMAKMLGRKFIGIEISQKYCDIAVRRLAQEYLF